MCTNVKIDCMHAESRSTYHRARAIARRNHWYSCHRSIQLQRRHLLSTCRDNAYSAQFSAGASSMQGLSHLMAKVVIVQWLLQRDLDLDNGDTRTDVIRKLAGTYHDLSGLEEELEQFPEELLCGQEATVLSLLPSVRGKNTSGTGTLFGFA